VRQSGQLDGAGQPRRTRPDNDNIHLEGFRAGLGVEE
jgi:hypothetical protein